VFVQEKDPIFYNASLGDAFDSILRWRDKDGKLIIIIYYYNKRRRL